MAKTLLNGTNDVLKRIGVIKGNSGELTSLTDTQRQVVIDLTIQAWNELLIDLYDSAEVPLPNEVVEATITLVTNTRTYSLATDLVQLRWPFTNQTDGHQIWKYPGGWDQIVIDQPQPANFTGQATYAVIRPTDGLLYLDSIPTASENGDVYTYFYDKELLMSAATDTFPFTDTVYQSLIAATAELVKRDRENNFDSGLYGRRIGIAAGQLTQNQQRSSWSPRRFDKDIVSSDPMEA